MLARYSFFTEIQIMRLVFWSLLFMTSILRAQLFQVTEELSSDLQSLSGIFSKQVDVFGLRVLSTSSVSDAKVLHTANVLAEYLDNDENGTVDQPEVLTKLLGGSTSEIATLVLFASENEQESFANDFEMLTSVLSRTQNLFADEIFENGSQGDDRDATLEEVLHLVTDLGWDEAFPEVWGERKGSSLADAMDLARGGYFENVDRTHPLQLHQRMATLHPDHARADGPCSGQPTHLCQLQFSEQEPARRQLSDFPISCPSGFNLPVRMEKKPLVRFFL